MKDLLEEISEEEFNNNVSVKFNNILDGFDLFSNNTLDFRELGYNEKDIIRLMNKIYDANNGECYIDLYLNKLTEENKLRIVELSDERDRKILLELINKKYSKVYFRLLSNELVPLITRLNTREIFFITLYFTKVPITIWGNYNLKFPCFFDTEETKKYYERTLLYEFLNKTI